MSSITSTSTSTTPSTTSKQSDVRLFGTHKQILGEGPFYDHVRNRFYQVDIKGKKVIRLELSANVSLPVQFQHKNRHFSEVVSFVIPLREPHFDVVVIGVRNHILIYDFEQDRVIRRLDFSTLLKGILTKYALFYFIFIDN
jgi:sugar lactone lactonase YvrE